MRTKDIKIGQHYGYSNSKRVWRYREVKVLEINPERKVSKHGGSYWEKTAQTIRVALISKREDGYVLWVRPHDIKMTWEEAQAANTDRDWEEREADKKRRKLKTEGKEQVERLEAVFKALSIPTVGIVNHVVRNGTIAVFLAPENAETLANVLSSYKNLISIR